MEKNLHLMGMIRSTFQGVSNKIIERKFPSAEELRKNLIPIFYMKKLEKKDVKEN